jgi:hypothetical protein
MPDKMFARRITPPDTGRRFFRSERFRTSQPEELSAAVLHRPGLPWVLPRQTLARFGEQIGLLRIVSLDPVEKK